MQANLPTAMLCTKAKGRQFVSHFHEQVELRVFVLSRPVFPSPHFLWEGSFIGSVYA